MQEVRFIADAMLGRLARWLRLLGFDTLYEPDIRDGDLLKTALREGRCILTRDTHFLRMKALKNLLFIRSENPVEQIVEVMRTFPDQAGRPGRCARCNGPLRVVGEKATVRDAVPEYVFLSVGEFFRCVSCGRIYWEGTHLKRFREMLGDVLPGGGRGEDR